MKKILSLLAALTSLTLCAQTVPQNVQKTPGTNAITADLVIGAGRTLTINGGTFTATGATLTLNGIAIDSSANITGVASLTVGTLSLTNPIGVTAGGTGVSSLTAYAPIFGGTTSTAPAQSGTVGTAGQLMRSSGAGVLPTWTTATFPATAGTNGNVLTSNGTNWVSSAPAGGAISGATSGQVVVATGATTGTSYAGFTSDTSGNLTASSLQVTGGNNIGSANTAVINSGTGYIYLGAGGGIGARNAQFFGMSSTVNVQWNSTASDWTAAPDVGLTRNAAGILEVNNGTPGSFAAIKVSNFTASGTITPSQISGIVGTTTNNSVGAGGVGEYVSSAVASASAVTLTTATAANVTSISLTAGDWDVEGNVSIVYVTATASAMQSGVSSTSATLPTDGTESYSGVTAVSGSGTNSIAIPRQRFSLSGTTTVYLVGKLTFTGTSAKGFGSITARRVR